MLGKQTEKVGQGGCHQGRRQEGEHRENAYFRGTGDATGERIVAGVLIADHVLVLRLHDLSVVVGDVVVEGVLEALAAHALVAAGVEAPSENGHAEGGQAVALVRVAEGVRSVDVLVQRVVVRLQVVDVVPLVRRTDRPQAVVELGRRRRAALVDVQTFQRHVNGDDALQLDASLDGVRPEEGHREGDHPLVVKAAAVEVGHRPEAVADLRRPVLQRIAVVADLIEARRIVANVDLRRVLLQLLGVHQRPAHQQTLVVLLVEVMAAVLLAVPP